MADNIISALNIGGNKYEIHSTSAIDADKLDGLHASTFASASDVTTLQGYFNNGSARSAEKATSAEKAASAGKLTAAQTIQATGDVSWSVSFDGSSSATGAATINNVPWTAASSLTNSTITTAQSTGFASPSAVAKAISDQIGSVYKVMGDSTWGNLTATSAKVNGNVYNLTGTVPDTAEDRNGNKLLVGDNVVYVTAGTAGWDKLASTIDTSNFALKTGNYISDGLSAKYASGAGSAADAAKLGNVDATAVTASAANGQSAYNWITDNKTKLLSAVSTSGYIIGDGTAGSNLSLDDTATSAINSVTGAVTTSAGMTAAANTGKLATVGAITGYIEEQLDETIDIAEEISDANASKIPYVSAVKNYVDNFSGNYVEYTDTSKTAIATISNNNSATKIQADKITLEQQGSAIAYSNLTYGSLTFEGARGTSAANYSISDAKVLIGGNSSASLTSVYTTVSGNSGSWANQNAYGIIKVEDSAGVLSSTTANTSQDTMYFKAGTNIDLVATGTDGHPTIEINAKESYVSAGVAYIF